MQVVDEDILLDRSDSAASESNASKTLPKGGGTVGVSDPVMTVGTLPSHR